MERPRRDARHRHHRERDRGRLHLHRRDRALRDPLLRPGVAHHPAQSSDRAQRRVSAAARGARGALVGGGSLAVLPGDGARPARRARRPARETVRLRCAARRTLAVARRGARLRGHIVGRPAAGTHHHGGARGGGLSAHPTAARRSLRAVDHGALRLLHLRLCLRARRRRRRSSARCRSWSAASASASAWVCRTW